MNVIDNLPFLHAKASTAAKVFNQVSKIFLSGFLDNLISFSIVFFFYGMDLKNFIYIVWFFIIDIGKKISHRYFYLHVFIPCLNP